MSKTYFAFYDKAGQLQDVTDNSQTAADWMQQYAKHGCKLVEIKADSRASAFSKACQKSTYYKDDMR